MRSLPLHGSVFFPIRVGDRKKDLFAFGRESGIGYSFEVDRVEKSHRLFLLTPYRSAEEKTYDGYDDQSFLCFRDHVRLQFIEK